MADLRFGGSVWCNLDIALRNIDEIYKNETKEINLAVIEWYILRVLYEQDGQMASHLAKAVGRAATSFTPILDQLEKKGLIERRMHPSDRRGVQIYLTSKANTLRPKVNAIAERVEKKISQRIPEKDWQSYQQVVANFQNLSA
jgi:DNA-binding MarR family transcriptional regulator